MEAAANKASFSNTALDIFLKIAVNAAILSVGILIYIAYVQQAGATAHHGWRVIILAVTTIAFIVLPPRFGFERWIEDKNWPGREAWASLIALGIALSQGIVSHETATSVFFDKIDIIAFILSFAILAEGLGRVGYIQFAAYYIVRKCNGDTARLVLYLYILTSIFTFLTSNDIVTLVMTPIIIAIAVQGGIKNPRLLLLSQFVAANTLAMGLLIGSPTNIIISSQLHVDFFHYMFVMLVPAIYSFFLSFSVVDFLNRSSRNGRGVGRLTRGALAWLGTKRWEFDPSYQVPHIEKYSHFNEDMKPWVWLFAVKVTLVSVVTYWGLSLFYVAIPTAVLSLSLYYYQQRHEVSFLSRLGTTLKLIYAAPLGILFFGMTFFILAKSLSQTSFFAEVIIPRVEAIGQHDVGFSGMLMILLSGISVNFFNDLPASALLAEIFTKVNFASPDARNLMLQGVLIGVNIGCYVTPVGALAGLIWFHRMGRERNKRAQEYALEIENRTVSPGGAPAAEAMLIDPRKLELPTRGDMIHYGLIHFVLVGVSLGLLLPFSALVIDFLLEPVKHQGMPIFAGQFPDRVWFWRLGALLTVFSIAWFRHTLTKYDILLSHLRGVFVGIVHFQLWAVRNRLVFTLLLLVTIFGSISFLLYVTEAASHDLYPGEFTSGKGLALDNVLGFALWFFVWVGGSFDNDAFPASVGGYLLVAFLPVSLLGILIFAFRSATTVRAQEVSERLASGAMPHYRTVILNFDPSLSGLLAQVLNHGRSFAVILCRRYHVDRTKALVESLIPPERAFEQTFVAAVDANPDLIASRYNIADADEIFLLDDGSREGALANLRHLALIDIQARKAAGIATPDDYGEDGWAGYGFGGITERDLRKIKLPYIVIEIPNDQMRELLRRTVSQALFNRIKIVETRTEVAEFLKADAQSDLIGMNNFYHFDDGLTAEERKRLQSEDVPVTNLGALSDSRKNLTREERRICTLAPAHSRSAVRPSDSFITDELRLNEYRITETSREALQRLFPLSLVAETASPEEKERQNQFIRERAMRIRVDLATRLKGRIKLDGGDDADISRVYGFGIKCAKARTRLSVGSVSMSGKTKHTDAVILLEPSGGKPPASLPFEKKARIIVINVNPVAEAFVKTLLASAEKDETKKPEIIVFAVGSGTTFIPRSLMSADRDGEISVVMVPPGYRRIADLLAPVTRSVEKVETVTKDRMIDPRLRAGDFIYVFLKPGESREAEEGMSDELYSVEVINRLMDRLEEQRVRKSFLEGPLERTDFYIAAEINNSETRFLFENVYIDDIFDSSWIRKSYFENLARAYYAPQTSSRMKQAFKRDFFDFKRADEIARLLNRYLVFGANDLKLTNERGQALGIVGETYGSVQSLIRAYSDPPMQLIGTCRLEMDGQDRLCLVPGKAQYRTPNEKIGEDDLLINLPII